MTLPLMICKALLERCSNDEQSALIALLPAEQRSQLNTVASATLPDPHSPCVDGLDKIHYSWFAPLLRPLAKQDLRLFLSVLSKQQVEGLKQLLGFSEPLPVLSKVGKEFIRHFLLKQLTPEIALIPLALIPASTLRPLLMLSHEQLLKLMHYLGLYDLSFEMKQIIATTQIKKILSALNKEETRLLKEISDRHDILVFKRLFLQGWNGSRSTLLPLLSQRGLQRLSLALYGQEPSLIWFVAHTLELGIATQLFKYCVQPRQKRIPQILTEQILYILSQALL